MVECRLRDPPQAENPASQDSFSAAVLCSLFRIPGRCEVGTQGVDYDGQSKDDQQDCNDQLQSFYQEGSRACRIRFAKAIVRCTSAVPVTQSMITSGGNSILLLRPVTFRNTHSVTSTRAESS